MYFFFHKQGRCRIFLELLLIGTMTGLLPFAIETEHLRLFEYCCYGSSRDSWDCLHKSFFLYFTVC